jgi:hypothetical protein
LVVNVAGPEEMAASDRKSQPTRRQLAELFALADGTLDSARVADVRAQIAASGELAELYERELRVVGVLLHARATIRAPEGCVSGSPRNRWRSPDRVAASGAPARSPARWPR